MRFSYPIPPRVSLDDALEISGRFLSERSGGDRALALAGALFDVIGNHFGLFAQVNRARINASDEAVGQVADLECIDGTGKDRVGGGSERPSADARRRGGNHHENSES